MNDVLFFTTLKMSSKKDFSRYETNNCCYCELPCDFSSQACGPCMKDASLYMMGMKKEISEEIKIKLPLKKKEPKENIN